MNEVDSHTDARGAGIVARVAAIDRKFAWSFLGVVISLVSLAVGAWFAMEFERRPSLKLEIIAESKIVQISKRVPDLKVLFQGSDILDSDKNLSAITMRVRNDGRADILEGGFDSTISWGAVFPDSTIVLATVEDATSSYLRDRFKVKIAATDRLEFDKIILERGNSVDVSVLVLHDSKNAVTIVPTGKVAGIGETLVVRTTPLGQGTFLSEVFSGGFGAHAVRAVAYPIGLVGFMVSIVGVIAAISDSATSISRRATLRRYSKAVAANDVRRVSLPVEKLFMSDGPRSIALLLAAVDKGEEFSRQSRISHLRRMSSDRNTIEMDEVYRFSSVDRVIGELAKVGLVTHAEGVMKFDKDEEAAIGFFAKFLGIITNKNISPEY